MLRYSTIFDDQQPYEVNRALAWEFKQYLDGLPTYADRQQCWLDIFGDFANEGKVFDHKTTTEFTLSLEPQSDEEKRLYYRVWLNMHRALAFKEGDLVGQYSTKTTFKVESFESLTAKFESTLKRHTSKPLRILSTETQLGKVTRIITNVLTNDELEDLDILIEELRASFKTEASDDAVEPYDILLATKKGLVNLVLLANVWDIIRFESDLTKRLRVLKSGTSLIASEQPLSNRQRLLVHAYEEKESYKRGDKDYNDYMKIQTPSKRIAYPNGSPQKAKRLIEDIKKILIHLSEKARIQAEKEIVTLED